MVTATTIGSISDTVRQADNNKDGTQAVEMPVIVNQWLVQWFSSINYSLVQHVAGNEENPKGRKRDSWPYAAAQVI